MNEIPDFETDTEELSPAEAHDRWERVTDLDLRELRALEDMPEHEAYLEQASEQRQRADDPPIAGGPLEDAIHLAATPRDEWGPDERAEAEEAINWGSRHGAQYDPSEGEDLTPETPEKTTKADVAGWRWAFDFNQRDDMP